ncbi:MAG: hypothetical protein GYB64_17275 [Chloroflexi bacterium]|nr:hypothetical protein [Chloroflexota bacterium]
MAATLQDVLSAFDGTTDARSLSQIAQDLSLEPARLQGMLDYWVRKGKLREVSFSGGDCGGCGLKSDCPFVTRMPRTYERVHSDDLPPAGCGANCGCR